MSVRLEDLPESLRDIVDLVGVQAAVRLVENFGGLTKLYVPKRVDEDHVLAKKLGLKTARALAEEYGGDEIRNIPRCLASIRAVRNARIRGAFDAGASAASLALRFGLTERQIWNILSAGASASAERQSELF